MKKFSKQIFFRFFCAIVAICLILFLPTINFGVYDNLDLIYGTFVGEKSKYQGIIEIWNIDTFESGSVSKFSHLTTIASSFQKKYKGCYVMVRNLTKQECENMLSSGQKPDLFSCSYGMAEIIEPYLQKFDSQNFNLQENFLQSGKIDDELYGVAWCCGLYFLISTKTALEKASVEYNDSFKLSENALKLGFIKEGKKTKKVYSLSTSQKNYLLPFQAIDSYNEKGETLISDLSFDKQSNLSQYEAYIDFLLGKSSMLLGTQRDVVRIKKRIDNNKIQDVIIEPLTKFSDIVQYLFLAKTDNILKSEYMQKFVHFMLNENNQKKVLEMKMFPTTNIQFVINESFFELIALENLKNIRLNNVFIEISEIKKLQQL